MIKIRPGRETDLPRLRELTVVCFDGVSIDQNIETQFGKVAGKDWRERKARHVDNDFAADPAGVLVAVDDDGRVLGYISCRLDRDTGIGRLANFAVDPSCQKQGLGRRLAEAALGYCRDQGMAMAKIETLAQNDIGQHFYPSLGFTEVARQIHYVMPLDEGQPE